MLYTLKTPKENFILDAEIYSPSLHAYIHYFCGLTGTPLFVDNGDGLVESIHIDALNIKNLIEDDGVLVDTINEIEYSRIAYEIIRDDEGMVFKEKSMSALDVIRKAKEEENKQLQEVEAKNKFPKHWDKSVFERLAAKALVEKLK